MKNILKKIGLAGVVVLAAGGAAMAVSATGAAGGVAINESSLCELIERMHDVFKILRTLAFIGAAFIIAGWAWGFISSGKVEMEDLRKKGTGMLVGFVLLFGIGVVLQFFVFSKTGLNLLGCEHIIWNW